MKIALDKAGSEENPELLHAEGHLVRIGSELVDTLEAKFKAINPDKPEAWRELCGGCILAVLNNMHTEVLNRADATDPERRAFYKALDRGTEHDAILDALDEMFRSVIRKERARG